MKKEFFRIANAVVYDDGSLDRVPYDPPLVPACPEPPAHLHPQVATLDLPLNDANGTSLRLFKPPLPLHTPKLPILLYFHGGAFILGSTAVPADHSFLCKLASSAAILIISVEYRLAPEHPLPAAYEDGIEALLWIHRQLLLGEHSTHPWLSRYADFSNCFIGGDSAGANIAHHVAMWAATGLGFERKQTDLVSEGASWCALDVTSSAPAMEGMSVQGVILIHPYFTCVADDRHVPLEEKLWQLAGVGIDHPFANPLLPSAPALAQAELPHYLVLVASEDMLAGRGIAFHSALVSAGGSSKLFTSQDEIHVFHLLKPDSTNVPALVDELCGFINCLKNEEGVAKGSLVY